MPKRVARRSAHRRPTRTARSSGTSGAETTRRWWNRIIATIITLGAIAGAIGAILALRPSPDPEDSARFTAVRIASQVPLSEYKQRSVAIVPEGSGHGLGGQRDRGALQLIAEPVRAADNDSPSPARAFAAARALQPDTTSSPTDPDTDTTAPQPSTSDDTDTTAPQPSTSDDTTSSTVSSSTATSPTMPGPAAPSNAGVFSPSVPLVVPPAFRPKEFREYTDEVLKRVDDQVPQCGKRCLVFARNFSTAPNGEPVPPDVAAERIVQLLKDARSTGGEQPGGEQPGGEPLGVVISADLELAGLRGKPVLLSWSMWQQGGKKRLYGNWLNRNLAYRLEATTDRDTTTLDLWVPLPKSPGPYFIRVNLTAAESPLASADSPPFD
jgi:hypothetical protein